MFRFETRIIPLISVILICIVAIYIIASENASLYRSAEQLRQELEGLKSKLDQLNQLVAPNITNERGARTAESRLDRDLAERLVESAPASTESRTNIFIETDNDHHSGRQFYKTAGFARNQELFGHVKTLPERARKRVLVTGGAGFVGSHLVDSLMLDGHQVTVCDNFFTGRRSNIEHWQGHPNFELINHDVINPLTIEVDQIYHLASPASPIHYMSNPIKTIKTNTVGTINMLGLAKRVDARILIASTSEIYGDPKVHPQSESYWGNANPVGPRSCYDESKRASESLAVAYNTRENVSVAIARIFNTYGPRMHPNDGRVVSNFIIQSLNNASITVYGSGEQTRSFQYVTDLVLGLKKLMASQLTSPTNLGNPNEMTIYSLAKQIKLSVPHSTSDIVFNKLPIDDPHRRKPDIRRAIESLDWVPVVSLPVGLRRTIEYFEQELGLL